MQIFEYDLVDFVRLQFCQVDNFKRKGIVGGVCGKLETWSYASEGLIDVTGNRGCKRDVVQNAAHHNRVEHRVLCHIQPKDDGDTRVDDVETMDLPIMTAKGTLPQSEGIMSKNELAIRIGFADI